jgi:hypothetical protein
MRIAFAALCLIPLSETLAEGKLSLFTAMDIGRLEEGRDLRTKDYDPSGLALNRTYVNVGFEQQLDERNFLSVGVGGIFWKAFESETGSPESKVIKFGPGISNAFMKWTPNDLVAVTFGYFPYKYNEASRNLGEYLFRTEAYPTVVFTGGWSWMNDARYNTVGAMLTVKTGNLKHDLGLFGEYFNAPIYDITPGYIATWKPTEGLTLGGGATLHRFLSPNDKVRKELTRSYDYYQNFYLPEVQAKTKYSVAIKDYIGQSDFTINYAPGQAPTPAAIKAQIWASDSSTLAGIYGITTPAAIPIAQDTAKASTSEGRIARRATMLKQDIDAMAGNDGVAPSTYYADPNNAGATVQSVAFDNRAVKLMAFFNLDFNGLLGLDRARMGAFELYGEIAQLGLKNYPIFYTESAQRRPLMLGASVPTLGLLEHLSFEFEYLKNPIIESIASTYDKLDLPPDGQFRYKDYNRDDYKWSVHASRNLNPFLSLYVQVANDHLRLKNAFAQPEYVPITNTPSQWYWLTRIQWAI